MLPELSASSIKDKLLLPIKWSTQTPKTKHFLGSGTWSIRNPHREQFIWKFGSQLSYQTLIVEQFIFKSSYDYLKTLNEILQFSS